MFCGDTSRCTIVQRLARVVGGDVRRVQPVERVDEDAGRDARRGCARRAGSTRASSDASDSPVTYSMTRNIPSSLDPTSMVDTTLGCRMRAARRASSRNIARNSGSSARCAVHALDGHDAREAALARRRPKCTVAIPPDAISPCKRIATEPAFARLGHARGASEDGPSVLTMAPRRYHDRRWPTRRTRGRASAATRSRCRRSKRARPGPAAPRWSCPSASDTLVVGTSPECDLTLEDAHVSRRALLPGPRRGRGPAARPREQERHVRR